jgi:RNA polymerase sigma factor (sigma-70 family)
MATAQLGAVLRHIRSLADDPNSDEQTDGALLRAFLSDNDQSAFEALLRRYGPMVLRVCQRTLGHVHDAEDSLQATFLVLARQGRFIRKKESLASWLHGVAYRMATHARRAAARRRGHEAQANPAQPSDPALRAAWQEIQGMLDEEIQLLPDTLRGTFVLCCLENRSCTEAARRLGLLEATVWKRLSRARKLLQERLSRRGVSLSAVLAAVAVGANNTSAALSPSLMVSTAKAAAQMVAGGALACELVSATVLTLAEGAHRAMFLGKYKMAIVLIACMTVLGTGLGLASMRPASAQAPKEPAPVEKATAGTGTAAEDLVKVRGRVVGPEDKPLAGAKLYLARSGRKQTIPRVRATSGADGRFAFLVRRSELGGGFAEQSAPQAMAVAEGYGCDWGKVNSEENELTFRLVKDVPVSGRILDPDGRPVVGARVSVRGVSAVQGDDLGKYIDEARKGFDIVFAKDWHGPLPGQASVLTTGADGRFRLTGVGRERIVYFRIEGPGIASTGLSPVMTRAVETIVGPKGRKVYGASFDHVALASRPIRGVVRDKATGKPLAGVTVGHYHGDGPNALTDKDGHYELLGLVKGSRYALIAKPADGRYFQRYIQFEDTPGLDALTGNIELVRGLTVRGRVRDLATGKPVAGARVDYHPLGGNAYVDKFLSGSWDPRSVTTTRSDGSYAITVMPGPGVIGVTARKRDAYMPAAAPLRERKDFFKTPLVDDRDENHFTVYAGGGSYGGISLDSYNAALLLEPAEREVALVKDVALQRPLERKGRVVGPDGQPLSGVTVIGLVASLPHRSAADPLKGDEFTVRDVNPKARRSLVFYHKGRNLGFYLKDLRSEAPGLLTVKLQPCGSASGRVINQDGQPVAGLRLHVPGRAVGSVGEDRWVITDKAGRFRAEGLVAGQNYWVWDATGSFPRVFATVVVEPGKHKDMGDIKMTERRE